jgi:ribonuclease P/MRP protein subunit RPP25
MRTYIDTALELLQAKGHQTIYLKAMGRAINKTVAVGTCAAVRLSWDVQETRIGTEKFGS